MQMNDTSQQIDSDMARIADAAQFPPDSDSGMPANTPDPDADDVLSADLNVKLKMETGLWQLVLNAMMRK
jgi:hypothetical protein